MKYYLSIILFVFISTIGCGPEQDQLIKGKLEFILKDDLNAIIEGIDAGNLIDSPRYEIVTFKTYDEGMYYALAVVDFYFLRNTNFKIVRKYRYNRPKKRWERFFNEYRYYQTNDTSATNDS